MKRLKKRRHKLVATYMFEYTDNITDFSSADSDKKKFMTIQKSTNKRT